MNPIYLDHCATTPIDSRVLNALLPFLQDAFGNPGTPHPKVGGVIQRAIRTAREQAAALINCRPNELIWTSGATEANNLAILGFAERESRDRNHVITQVTEHLAVLEPCRRLERAGWRVTYLPVDRFGRVSLESLAEAITTQTSLVSIMWGNNEIGTLQPIQSISELCEQRGIALHCDAAQTAGLMGIDLDRVPISMLTFSAHKMYGPKGVGALFVRDLNRRKVIAPRQFGGGQEQSLRAGTHNVPGIVGFGAACELAFANQSIWRPFVSQLRDRFEAAVTSQVSDVVVNGHQKERLPHVSSLAFLGTDDEGLLTMLPELVATTGSACHTAAFQPSHVLEALPVEPKPVGCSLRFGFGKDNNNAEVDRAATLIAKAVMELRNADALGRDLNGASNKSCGDCE